MVAPPLRANGVRLLAWLGLLLAALLVLDFAGWYGYIADVGIRIGLQVAAFVTVGGWLLACVVRPQWLPRGPLVLPVVAATAIFVLSGLLSQRLRLSVESVAQGVVMAALFLMLTRLCADTWFRNRIRVLVLAIPILVAGAYVVQVVASWIGWWGTVGSIVLLPPLRPDWAGLTFGSPNLVATVLLITGPLGVALVWQSKRRVAIASACLIVLAIFLTGSRSALIGLALAALAIVAVGLWRNRGRVDLRQRRVQVILVLAVVAAAVLAPVLAFRFAQGGEALRLDLWRSALSVFAQHPLLGSGPGTWAQLKLGTNPAGAPNLLLPHAHDAFVETLAEVGLIGFLALAVVVLAIGRRLLAGSRSVDRALRLEAAAVGLGLLAFAGQNLTDDVLNLPAITLLLALVVAWVDGGLAIESRRSDVAQPSTTPDRRGRAIAATALVALAACLPVVLTLDSAALAADRGNQVAASGDWTGALVEYDRAISLDPTLQLYHAERATALARLGKVDAARTELAGVVDQEPLALHLVSLSWLDAQAGDCASAMGHAASAMEQGPGEAGIALNAGAVADRCGADLQAVEWYGDVLADVPGLAADPYWQDPSRSRHWPEIVGAAKADLAAAGDWDEDVELLAAVGDVDQARAEIALRHVTEPSSLASVDWLAGDHDGAVTRLAAYVQGHPMDWESIATLSRLSWLGGDDADAVRYAAWARGVQADSAVGVEFIPNHIGGDGGAGSLAPDQYPWVIYLRNGPPAFWPPGMLIPILSR
jgi:O-antigen ligase